MELHILNDINELSKNVADFIVENIQEVLKKKDRFAIALSGGSTPEKLHHLLASETYKNKIDWSRLHVFWGDERFVPFNDSRNNAKMVFDTLLNFVPVPKEQIHIMQTENISPEKSAEAYEKILDQYFLKSPNTFDLIILGMGDDAHTLSLFPGKTEVIFEEKRQAVSLWLESQNMYRITLTHPIANKASVIVFLASGNKKAKALAHVLNGNYDPALYPSQIINPVNGELHWFVDKEAAQDLEEKRAKPS